MNKTGLKVYIYRSGKQPDTYLYLPEKDNFKALPNSLCNLLGQLIFSFEFNLTPERKLMQTNADTVLKSISIEGYFLHLPPSSKLKSMSLDEMVPSGF